MWLVLLKDFFQDLKVQRTRAMLTIVAITWGTIAVVLLLSFGNGLGRQMQRQAFPFMSCDKQVC